MRVLLVNTSENTGGAAVAANRLMNALNNNGVKAKMLVRDKLTNDITVVGLPQGPAQHWHFLWERWCIYCHLHFSKKHLFEIDIANSGNDITHLREFKEADVIHLHWINQGMLSLSDIRKILESGKPVVWTMHDFWPATAICHYPHQCTAFAQDTCHNCPYLPGGGSAHDLAHAVWKKKDRILSNHNLFFVTCSRWLGNKVKNSRLLTGKMVTTIPNPIDTHLFKPEDKKEARMRATLPQGKRLILFVSQRITDKRKGVSYFIEACRLLAGAHPELRDDLCVVILGGHAEDIAPQLPLPVYPIGYIADERRIVDVYNSVDLFVLPSLEDNLPNTIIEAMACGVPCVGFNTGGIPEEIDHKKNGYIAQYKNAQDLAAGMEWTLLQAPYAELSDNAVKKVSAQFSQHAVALKYSDVYEQAMAFNNYRL